MADNWDFFDVIEQVHHYNIMDADDKSLRWLTYDEDDALMDHLVLTR